MTPQPIPRRKLADEVKDRVLEMIRSGQFQPGDQLPSERSLMDQFSVGRPAVREALQALASAGVIVISHGERARVAVPDTQSIFGRLGDTMLHLLQTSPRTLEDLKEARLLFEVGMVKNAARFADAEDLRCLESVLQAQEAAIRNIPEFVKCDMAFHKAIAAISGNSVCTMLSEAMLDWLFHFRHDLLRLPGSEQITLAEHQRLLDAIAAKDPDEAEAAMRDHLSRSSERYRALENELAC